MLIKEFTEQMITDITNLCNESMEFDNISEKILVEKTISDSDYLPLLTKVAVDDKSNKPIGFIQAVIRNRDDEKTGYIKLFCVHPEFRLQGIGSVLYNTIEKQLQEFGVQKIRVYESYPNYFMPGIDPLYTEAVCFFESRGFKKFADTTNLLCKLEGENFNVDRELEKLKSVNIYCSLAKSDDKEKILNWINQNFKPWFYEVSEAFNNNPVSLFVAEKDDKTIAFSAYNVNNKTMGWFGPMGTEKKYRGFGIGSILLKLCLKEMQNQKFPFAIIPWVGPIKFYMKNVNAKVHRVFWRYEKILC